MHKSATRAQQQRADPWRSVCSPTSHLGAGVQRAHGCRLGGRASHTSLPRAAPRRAQDLAPRSTQPMSSAVSVHVRAGSGSQLMSTVVGREGGGAAEEAAGTTEPPCSIRAHLRTTFTPAPTTCSLPSRLHFSVVSPQIYGPHLRIAAMKTPGTLILMVTLATVAAQVCPGQKPRDDRYCDDEKENCCGGGKPICQDTGHRYRCVASVNCYCDQYNPIPVPCGTLLSDCIEWQGCARSNGHGCSGGGNQLDLYFDNNCMSCGLAGSIPGADIGQMTGLSSIWLQGNALARRTDSR